MCTALFAIDFDFFEKMVVLTLLPAFLFGDAGGVNGCGMAQSVQTNCYHYFGAQQFKPAQS